MAVTGKPLPKPLPSVVMSGIVFQCSMANILPVRPIQVSTSSAMSMQPSLSHTANDRRELSSTPPMPIRRAAGKPEPTTTNNPFTDVKESNYYYKAVLWAVENGVTGGTSATTFSPKKTCTREQIVTFLYAAAPFFS